MVLIEFDNDYKRGWGEGIEMEGPENIYIVWFKWKTPIQYPNNEWIESIANESFLLKKYVKIQMFCPCVRVFCSTRTKNI